MTKLGQIEIIIKADDPASYQLRRIADVSQMAKYYFRDPDRGKMEKLNLIKEIIDDWDNGKLSDGGALAAIEIIIYPRYEPTRADIERAQAISSSIAAALLRKSLKGGKSIKIPSLNIEIAPPDEGESEEK